MTWHSWARATKQISLIHSCVSLSDDLAFVKGIMKTWTMTSGTFFLFCETNNHPKCYAAAPAVTVRWRAALQTHTHTHTSRIAIHEQILFYFYVFIFVFIYLFLVAPVLRGHGELGAIGPGSTMLSRQNEPKRWSFWHGRKSKTMLSRYMFFRFLEPEHGEEQRRLGPRKWPDPSKSSRIRRWISRVY